MADGFKYFIKIAKAYEENGEWYVEGIASGTLEDRDDQRMNISVLQRFVNSVPLPLTNSHPKAGDIMGELGEVVSAEILDDEFNSLFIKARLDQDHPANQLMLKKITKDGKKYAFSIEGTKPVVKTVWSENLNKFIDEFIDVQPRAISITTEPSYMPSFMEVVAKAYRKSLTEDKSNDKNNINITKTNMADEVKTETPVEATSEVVEVKTEETTQAQPEETTPEKVEVVEDKANASITETETQEAPTEATPVEKSVKKEDAKEPDGDESMIGKMCKMMEAMSTMMGKMMEKMDSTEEDSEAATKSVKNLTEVIKSLVTEIEVIKSLPLQKKSLVSKSFEERTETAPKTVKDLISNSVNFN